MQECVFAKTKVVHRFAIYVQMWKNKTPKWNDVRERKRAFENCGGKIGHDNTVKPACLVPTSLPLSLSRPLPLTLCVYIKSVFRLLNVKTSIEQRCWFDLCYFDNVRVNGHTAAAVAAALALVTCRKCRYQKFLAYRVHTHTRTISALAFQNYGPMFARNVDDNDNEDGAGDGRQLGKTVRKLENELAYLMEYHVLSGLCACDQISKTKQKCKWE